MKLGFDVSERTVSRLIPRRDKKPSQTWGTFLRNHVGQLVSVDFFTVPTIQLRLLYVFLILAHDRRRVLHFNVTEHPTAVWAAQQIVEAFPDDSAPRYLVRDRDGIYGHCFTTRVVGMGIEQVRTAARSPWQNCFVERIIGSFVVLNKTTDQPFHERMRQGRVRHRFDFFHFEHPEIGLPLVEPEQRIVI